MAIVLVLFFLFSAIAVSSSASPDRFIRSVPLPLLSKKHKPQEYFEVTRPLTMDHLTPSCNHTIVHHSFANTVNSRPFTAPYSPPYDCPSPWSLVVLNFHVKSRGDQYDRISGLWLGGVELLRTSTAEPTPSGIFWNVRKDVTRYSALFMKRNLNVTMMLENVVNRVYTGVYHVHVRLLFYKHNTGSVPSSLLPKQSSNSKLMLKKLQIKMTGEDLGKDDLRRKSRGLYGYEQQSPADLIIPISDDGNRGFWFTIESQSDIHLKRIRIPCNTRRIILELYVSFHGNDEFWYSNPPNSYIRTNNLTTGRGNGAYREVMVTIDGKYVGSEVPYPIIFTGGINPLFWEPVVAIGAFNLPSYDLDLTPFLGLLLDGKPHQFGLGVLDAASYWLVDANLHIWLDHNSSKVKAKYVTYRSPAVSIVRHEVFKLLDGSFRIKATRHSQFAGWALSSAGNLTSFVSQAFKVTSLVKFKGNGTYKMVKHRVKARRDMRLSTDMGVLVAQAGFKRRYPLNVVTLTLPGLKKKDKNTYVLVTNVSHALYEKYSDGQLSGSVSNRQVSLGWMKVKDHSVLSGEAKTNQSFSCKDALGCYTRTVAASNGKLIVDNSAFSCLSSI